MISLCFFLIIFNLCDIHCKFSINDDILYGVTWHNEPLKDDITGGVTLLSKNRESYQCLLPSNPKEKYENAFDEGYKGPTELEILQSSLFSNKFCSIKVESYWSYEICHGRYVRQFHEETVQGKSSSNLQEYFLGTYSVKSASQDPSDDAETLQQTNNRQIPTISINSVNFPYFKVNMTDGTRCDLIDGPRSIAVLYVCQQEGKGEVYDIQEVRTCQYQAVVFTRHLCSHPAYKITDNFVNSISCYPMGAAPAVPQSLADLHEEIKTEVNSISSLDGLFNDNLNFGSQIKVEAFKENGVIVYRIKTVPRDTPVPEESPADSQDTKSTQQTKPANPQFPPDGTLLNKFLSGRFCVDGGDGWWRHRVCYQRKISQYHMEMHVETAEIILGIWDQQRHLRWLKDHPDKRPTLPADQRMEIHHYFSDGSFCDEIKARRDAVLRIRCVNGGDTNSSRILISFLEPTVCSYVITVESAMFCPVVREADEFGLMSSPADD